jgi:hypothetical protein
LASLSLSLGSTHPEQTNMMDLQMALNRGPDAGT